MRALFAIALALYTQFAAANEALWQRLRDEPNLVVLMRHTQPARGSPLIWDQSGKCEGESMLTAEGIVHARRIGEEFRKHGITPTVIISSPMCRCRDTARLAFEQDPTTGAALREIASADAERTTAFEQKALSLIATNRGPSPVVFVSHQPNIDLIALELIDLGDLLVALSSERGELTVLGKFHVK